MKKNEITSAIRQLDVFERLSIITEIWDEINDSKIWDEINNSKNMEILTERDKMILLNRLSDYRKNPASAVDWTNLKKDTYQQYGK